jgi:hypothetical protein
MVDKSADWWIDAWQIVINQSPSYQYPTWLPGLHRAGPSTPLDERLVGYSFAGGMVTWVGGFVKFRDVRTYEAFFTGL